MGFTWMWLFEQRSNQSCSSSTVSNVFQVSSNVAGFTFHIVLIIIKSSSSSSIWCIWFSSFIISSTYRYNPANGANCEDALLESVHHEE